MIDQFLIVAALAVAAADPPQKPPQPVQAGRQSTNDATVDPDLIKRVQDAVQRGKKPCPCQQKGTTR